MFIIKISYTLIVFNELVAIYSGIGLCAEDAWHAVIG